MECSSPRFSLVLAHRDQHLLLPLVTMMPPAFQPLRALPFALSPALGRLCCSGHSCCSMFVNTDLLRSRCRFDVGNKQTQKLPCTDRFAALLWAKRASFARFFFFTWNKITSDRSYGVIHKEVINLVLSSNVKCSKYLYQVGFSGSRKQTHNVQSQLSLLVNDTAVQQYQPTESVR